MRNIRMVVCLFDLLLLYTTSLEYLMKSP